MSAAIVAQLLRRRVQRRCIHPLFAQIAAAAYQHPPSVNAGHHPAPRWRIEIGRWRNCNATRLRRLDNGITQRMLR